MLIIFNYLPSNNVRIMNNFFIHHTINLILTTIITVLMTYIVHMKHIKCKIQCYSRQRPYHIEHTSSRPITEVKQC